MCLMSILRFLRTKALKRRQIIFDGERITLPKTSILSVFEVVTYTNDKMHGKYPILSSERTLLDMRIIRALELLRYKNAKSCE